MYSPASDPRINLRRRRRPASSERADTDGSHAAPAATSSRRRRLYGELPVERLMGRDDRMSVVEMAAGGPTTSHKRMIIAGFTGSDYRGN